MLLSRRQIPNVITAMRVLLVIPIAVGHYYEEYRNALFLFFVAGVSDALDGFLARRFNWRSRFGAIADPLADKLLLVTAFLFLTLNGQIFLWLMLLVFLRDLVIVAGALAYHYLRGAYDMNPTWLGKLNTLIQIAFVLMIMLHQAGVAMPVAALIWGPWLVALITAASGMHYVILWGRKFIAGRVAERLDSR